MTVILPTPIFLTGASGFLGVHLLAALRGVDGLIVTFGRRKPAENLGQRHWFGDLGDFRQLKEAIDAVRPRTVFHLAGQTPHPSSRDYYRTNVRGMDHLLDALRDRSVRLVSVGSAAEIGAIAAEEMPISETVRCRPVGPYALSKWFSTRRALQAKLPLESVAARIFNLIGPGAPNTQALGRFAELLTEPVPDPLRMVVGDLQAGRDFLDVRDAAEALLLLAAAGRPNALYHVGSGESRKVGDALNDLIRLSGRRVLLESVVGDSGPSDSRADIGKIQRETGWSPRIDWNQSVRDLWKEAERRAGRSTVLDRLAS